MGILPLDKPVGPTSHDMVGRARRLLGMRRIGHAGTLDPFASGLLLLCLGSATRLVEELHDLDKVYEAVAHLGVETTSDDPEGEVVAQAPDEAWQALGEEVIRAALREQVGDRMQRPPVYSSKKVKGEAAHRRVRRGEKVELPPVPVRIHALELVALELPFVRFRVHCGTGTYVRAIARDLGQALGVGAHLTELRRTRIGPFSVEDAVSPEDAARVEPGAGSSPRAEGDPGPERARWMSHLLPPLAAVRHLPMIRLTAEEEARLRMGQRVEPGGSVGLPGEVGVPSPAVGATAREAGAPAPEVGGASPEAASPGNRVALLGPRGLIGIGSWEGEQLRPRKILPPTDEEGQG